MKRIISLIIIAAMLVVNFTTSPTNASELYDKSDLSIAGYRISVEDFNKGYCSSSSVIKSIEELESAIPAKAQLRNVYYDGKTISFEISITVNESTASFGASGQLHSSYKAQDGINSAVVEMKTTSNDYIIKYLELYNDTKSDDKLIYGTFVNTPHLKLYLLDVKGNILLFESTLPDGVTSTRLQDLDTADSLYDSYWFIGVAKPYESFDLVTDDKMIQYMQVSTNFPKGLGYFSLWCNPTTYYRAYYAIGDYWQSWSLPYASMMHNNIGYAPWSFEFKIAEHTNINGVLYRNVHNPIRYFNVNISMGCGARTTFMQSFQNGRVDNNGVWFDQGDLVWVSVMTTVVSYIPGTTTIGAAEYISNALTEPFTGNLMV